MSRNFSLPSVVWLHGQLVPDAEAVVSVHDRSFLYGDGLFETLTVVGWRPVFERAHLERLERGSVFLGIRSPFNFAELSEGIAALIRAMDLESGSVRIHLSRGVGQRGYSPRGADSPKVVITAHRETRETEDLQRWCLATASFRCARGDVIAQFKTASKLLCVLARAEAEAAGAQDALILDTEGKVLETASGSLFWIEDGVLLTPPVGAGLLSGITREAVLKLAPELGLTVVETTANLERLHLASGVFVTLSTRGVVEISRLDQTELRTSEWTGMIWSELWKKMRL